MRTIEEINDDIEAFRQDLLLYKLGSAYGKDLTEPKNLKNIINELKVEKIEALLSVFLNERRELLERVKSSEFISKQVITLLKEDIERLEKILGEIK